MNNVAKILNGIFLEGFLTSSPVADIASKPKFYSKFCFKFNSMLNVMHVYIHTNIGEHTL